MSVIESVRARHGHDCILPIMVSVFIISIQSIKNIVQCTPDVEDNDIKLRIYFSCLGNAVSCITIDMPLKIHCTSKLSMHVLTLGRRKNKITILFLYAIFGENPVNKPILLY